MEYRLTEEALVFGGKTLVATDIAVAAGFVKEIGNIKTVSHLSEEFVYKAVEVIQKAVEEAVDSVKVFDDIFLLAHSKSFAFASFDQDEGTVK